MEDYGLFTTLETAVPFYQKGFADSKIKGLLDGSQYGHWHQGSSRTGRILG
jgi:hypothetical protein